MTLFPLSAAAAVLLLASPAWAAAPAGEPEPADCRDDDGVDRCAPETQKRVRELFGVRPIEDHRAAGDQVRRVFYVDGYGRDIVAIEFIRPRGADPLVRVHFPAEAGEPRVAPLTALVDDERWAALIRRSAHFDRALAKAPEPADGGSAGKGSLTRGQDGVDNQVVVICLHSWLFTAEASDPAEGGEAAPPVRRRTEGACDNGLTEAFAEEMEAAAVSLLPACAMLDPQKHRNDAERLSACRLLSGDRQAAARVFNAWHPFRHASEAEDVALLRPAFELQATVEWAGESKGEADPADFWMRKHREADVGAFFVDMIVAESPERVRLTGELHRSVGEGDERRWEVAPVEQTWVGNGGDYQVERAVVGPFTARKEP